MSKKKAKKSGVERRLERFEERLTTVTVPSAKEVTLHNFETNDKGELVYRRFETEHPLNRSGQEWE